MSDVRPVSEFELAVVGVLRRFAYRRLLPDFIAREAKVKRRSVRHHLARLEEFGVVEEVDADPPGSIRLPAWQWSGPEGHPHVERLRVAARARGRDLPPVEGPPQRCGEGHDLTDPDVGYTYPSGYVACIACGEVVMVENVGAVMTRRRSS